MLSQKKLFLLDIDGTVCIGKKLIDGTKEFLDNVVRKNGKFIFITNNATKGIDDYIKTFHTLGIETDESNFITAGYATARYLQENYNKRLVYVMGTDSFISELKKHGIQVTTNHRDKEISCAVVSYDNELTYEKIKNTCELLSTKDIDYIATNPDYVCPIEFGYVPDCGAICQMIEHAVKKTPHYIGKPETAMIDYALKCTHYTKAETIVIGDRLYTDILCGQNAGVDTALVLTGEASREDVNKNKYKPTYIFESIKEVLQ